MSASLKNPIAQDLKVMKKTEQSLALLGVEKVKLDKSNSTKMFVGMCKSKYFYPTKAVC